MKEEKEWQEMIEIEKGIEMPEVGIRKYKYPLRMMEIGDSFVAPIEKWNSISAQVSTYRKTAGNKKFTARKINDKEIRIWRIQ